MMKKYSILALSVLMSIVATIPFTACSNAMDYEEEKLSAPAAVVEKSQRTVLVYIAGRNDLSLFAGYDLQELKDGSKQLAEDQVLLVFMRRGHHNEEPWLARIKNGDIVGKVTDYIVGSPAEIPGMGAPYQQVVPAMFEPATCCHSIAERYYEATEGQLPLSVVKTSEMERVAQATREVLKSMSERESGFPDMTGMIHYNYLGSKYDPFCPMYNMFYDAGNFIRRYATREEYHRWKQALDRAVVEKYIAYSWDVVKGWQKFYTDFEVTEEDYHGVSMFVPQDHTAEHGECYAKFNQDIAQMQWLHAVNN